LSKRKIYIHNFKRNVLKKKKKNLVAVFFFSIDWDNSSMTQSIGSSLSSLYLYFEISISIGIEFSSCLPTSRVMTDSIPFCSNSACNGSRLVSNDVVVPVDSKPIRLSILVKSGRSRLNLN